MCSADKVELLLTCRLGMERVVASYIRELDPSATVEPAPLGFQGLVLICNASDKTRLADEIRRRVPEVEKVFVVEGYSKADVSSIAEVASNVALSKITSTETFAVRTVRRGEHPFTSIDVNVAAGSAVEKATGASVDLENPDKVVFVNIIGEAAYISVLSGSEVYKKIKPYKYPVYKLFRKFVVAHEPYLGPLKAAYTMGRRIGREVQTFEIGELIVAPIGEVDARSLYGFLKGLFEGIESRFKIQKSSYGREVHKVKVKLQDMYQFVRSRFGQPLVVFEPEGEPISKVGDELSNFIIERVKAGKRVYFMVGAREGVPPSIFRFADYVLDVAPGVVISTEYALASALIALTTILHEKLVTEKPDLDREL